VLHHGEKRDKLASYIVRDSTIATMESKIFTPRISHERLRELNKAIKSKQIFKKKVINGKLTTTKELNVPEADVRYWKDILNIKGSISQAITKNSVLTLVTAKRIAALDLTLFKDSPFWIKWRDMVLDESITWETITSIRLIPEITEAYDITAPPNFTMVTESGFVIQDTMQVHLPITDEAIEETKNMFPSKLLFSDKKKDHLLMMPSQEPITGLYTVTKNLGKFNGTAAKKYRSESEAWAAYYRGELKMTDNVEIG
jgi:hypothetical protein